MGAERARPSRMTAVNRPPAPRLRCFVAPPLAAGRHALPAGAARHVQVRRLQPGDPLVLFDGTGGEWAAEVVQMAKAAVVVQVLRHAPVEREAPVAVTLAFAMPAGDRMDALLEGAVELGAAAIHPLHAARSVLRLEGERAAKRVAHWQAVAVAACEQCGRNRVPEVARPEALAAWLASLPARAAGEARWLLSTAEGAAPWPPPGAAPDAGPQAAAPFGAAPRALVLSGPEGGFEPAEEAAARAAGFVPVSLGARVLRADTAPLAALALLACGTLR
jgi:16S rRNA (uracil1498-N3)-methyltransferase